VGVLSQQVLAHLVILAKQARIHGELAQIQNGFRICVPCTVRNDDYFEIAATCETLHQQAAKLTRGAFPVTPLLGVEEGALERGAGAPSMGMRPRKRAIRPRI
jgi:hypothetical protein